MLAVWSSVSPYGKRATNSSKAPSGGVHHRRLAQLPQRRDLDEVGGDLADALLEARLARLPGDATEAIELHLALGRAVARQQLDVLHRQEELGAFGVGDLQAVVRGAQRGDGGEAVEAADAVIGVHDEIADAEAGRFRDDVGGPPRLAPGPHQPVAQDVLLADHGQVGRLEALLQRQHGERGSVGRQRADVGEALDLAGVGEMVLAEQGQQALARALRERCEDHPLALGLQGAHVPRRRIEHVAALAGTLQREVAPDPTAIRVQPALLAVGSLAADRCADRESRCRGTRSLCRLSRTVRSVPRK